MKTNLQLALDFASLDPAMRLAREVEDYVDWVEAGTPLIIGEGIKAVAKLKESFSDKTVVADLKIMDGGGLLSELAFGAGADVVTILGHAADATICRAVERAKRHGAQVLVDMLNVRDIADRIRQVEALGIDYIGIHTGWDAQELGNNTLQDLQVAAEASTLPRVVAGGINPDTIGGVLRTRPATIVVGTAITAAKNPRGVVELLRERMKESGLS